MKRPTAVLASVVATAGLLSGCGGADTYCDSLGSAEESFQRLEASDFSSFDEFADQVQGFAEEAPDEVRDDWMVISDAFNAFIDALDEIGLEPQDLGEDLPDGVEPDAFGAAMAAAQKFSSEEFLAASDNIDKHARDECNFDFEGS